MPTTLEQAILDPRLYAPSIDRRLMPACDGEQWPSVETADAIERQKLEFLAAYTHLNAARERLQNAGGSPTAEAAQAQQAGAFRDRLEDRYAPVGFYAEPVMDGHLAVDLVFHYARKYVQENHRAQEPIEATLKVPLPDADDAASFADVPGISIETIMADLQLPMRKKP